MSAIQSKTVALQLVQTHGETPKDPLSSLNDLFLEKTRHHTLSMHDREAIGEYYRVIENRGLPAYQWMAEVFTMLGKKEMQKRNMRYAVGILRSWLKFGFGHIPSAEERDILAFFEEVIGQEASPEAVHMIQQAMGEHGVVKLTRAIAKVEQDKGVFMMTGIAGILSKL